VNGSKEEGVEWKKERGLVCVWWCVVCYLRWFPFFKFIMAHYFIGINDIATPQTKNAFVLPPFNLQLY
jgi:hypothetical protein